MPANRKIVTSIEADKASFDQTREAIKRMIDPTDMGVESIRDRFVASFESATGRLQGIMEKALAGDPAKFKETMDKSLDELASRTDVFLRNLEVSMGAKFRPLLQLEPADVESATKSLGGLKTAIRDVLKADPADLSESLAAVKESLEDVLKVDPKIISDPLKESLSSIGTMIGSALSLDQLEEFDNKLKEILSPDQLDEFRAKFIQTLSPDQLEQFGTKFKEALSLDQLEQFGTKFAQILPIGSLEKFGQELKKVLSTEQVGQLGSDLEKVMSLSGLKDSYSSVSGELKTLKGLQGEFVESLKKAGIEPEWLSGVINEFAKLRQEMNKIAVEGTQPFIEQLGKVKDVAGEGATEIPKIVRSMVSGFIDSRTDIVEFNKEIQTSKKVSADLSEELEKTTQTFANMDPGVASVREMRDSYEKIKDIISRINDELAKSGKAPADLAIYTQEMKSHVEEQEKSLSRFLPQSKGFADNMKEATGALGGLSKIPGMEGLGQLGSIAAGGGSIASIIQAVGIIVSEIDKFIVDSRETRRAMATPGSEIGTISQVGAQNIADRLRVGIAEGGGPMLGSKDFKQFMGIAGGGFGAEVEVGGTGQTMRELIDTIGHGYKVQEELATRQGVQGGIAGRVGELPLWEKIIAGVSPVGAIGAMAEATTTQVARGRTKVEATPEEGKAIEDFDKAVQGVKDSATESLKFSTYANISVEDYAKSLQRLSRLSPELENNQTTLSRDFLALAYDSKEARISFNDWMPIVESAQNKMRHFGFQTTDTSFILSKYGDEIKRGVLSVETFTGAIEKAARSPDQERVGTEYAAIMEILPQVKSRFHDFGVGLEKAAQQSDVAGMAFLAAMKSDKIEDFWNTRSAADKRRLEQEYGGLEGLRRAHDEYNSMLQKSGDPVAKFITDAVGPSGPFESFYTQLEIVDPKLGLLGKTVSESIFNLEIFNKTLGKMTGDPEALRERGKEAAKDWYETNQNIQKSIKETSDAIGTSFITGLRGMFLGGEIRFDATNVKIVGKTIERAETASSTEATGPK